MGTKTSWPAVSDVTNILTLSGFDSSDSRFPSNTLIQEKIDGTVAELLKRTKIQFIPSEEERTFNGSGTDVMTVDEYVTLNNVYITYGSSSWTEITTAISGEDKLFPKTKIFIARGNANYLYSSFLRGFPRGFENIKIDANWGYDTYIPDDVWDMVRLKAASSLANLLSLSFGQLPKKWVEKASEEFQGGNFSSVTDIDRKWKELISLYVRDMRTRKSRLGRTML